MADCLKMESLFLFPHFLLLLCSCPSDSHMNSHQQHVTPFSFSVSFFKKRNSFFIITLVTQRYKFSEMLRAKKPQFPVSMFLSVQVNINIPSLPTIGHSDRLQCKIESFQSNGIMSDSGEVSCDLPQPGLIPKTPEGQGMVALITLPCFCRL